MGPAGPIEVFLFIEFFGALAASFADRFELAPPLRKFLNSNLQFIFVFHHNFKLLLRLHYSFI